MKCSKNRMKYTYISSFSVSQQKSTVTQQ